MSTDAFSIPRGVQWKTPTPTAEIGHVLLKVVFPIAYALMIAPLTYQFFDRTVTPPEFDGTVLGVITLANVHRAALAPFLVGLELISVRLAGALWRERLRARARLAVFAVFLLLQALPAASVYFDARVHDFHTAQAAAQGQQHVSQEDQARYEAALMVWNQSKGDLKTASVSLQEQISTAYGQRERALARLRAPGTLAERETAQAEVGRLADTLSVYEQRQRGLEASLVDLVNNPPKAPQQSAVPQAVLLETDVDFIVRTAATANSLLAGLIAVVLVAVVLGAGFAISSTAGGLETRPSLPLDLGAQLAVCRRLPPLRQRAFVPHLASTIRFDLEAARAMRRQAAQNAVLQLSSEGEISEIEALVRCKAEIARGGLAADARDQLEREVDELIAGTLATGS